MLPRLVEEAAGRDLSGLEPLAGIPGSLGGALAMNAGAHGHSIGELVERVTFWERGAGMRSLPQEGLSFSYRDSLLRQGGRVALEAVLFLAPCEPGQAQRRVREALARRKARQPLGLRSAGSVFRNPEGAYAGALIEAAGLKGTRVGEAEVSRVHANFIVNRGRATAAEVKALMELARRRVKETSGIDLHPEVVVWED
jgi:UDP-N-acetylmuramate dehydrogenase